MDEIRLVCTALCRIVDKQARYLLALNHNRLLQQKQVFMALGGALEYSNSQLPRIFDARLENSNQEFRWSIARSRLDEFRLWFNLRKDREINPFRELREELVDQLRLFNSLSPRDVCMNYAWTVEVERKTDRFGLNTVLTHYFHELFDVIFVSQNHQARLLQLPKHDQLRWVTRQEIEGSSTEDNITIDANILLISR